MAALDGTRVARRETLHEPTTRLPRSSRGAMDWDDVRVDVPARPPRRHPRSGVDGELSPVMTTGVASKG
jgi:hypothetical protein